MMSAARLNREEIISLLIDKGASMELAISVSKVIDMGINESYTSLYMVTAGL